MWERVSEREREKERERERKRDLTKKWIKNLDNEEQQKKIGLY